ncbi:hypothetical protein [Endothiovibrio diazotrophicus]
MAIYRPEMGLYRVSDGLELPATSITVSIDGEAAMWQMRADLRGGLSEVEYGTEVEARINGYSWRFVVSTIDDDRSNDGRSVTIGGLSLSARLAAPYATARSVVVGMDALAQQLAAAELEFTGWDIDWRCADWWVPAGAWSYQDLTPLGAISQIARAGGGRVRADRSRLRLVTTPRYPSDPAGWSSSTPDVTVAGRRVIRVTTRWAPKPAYDRAVVMGRTGHGVLVVATRSGAYGANPAPEVVDPLITDVDAGRGRAQEILWSSGDGAISTLRLPLAAAGLVDGALIEPDQLVRVMDTTGPWSGLSGGVQVTGQRDRDGKLTVYQTVEVERRVH